MRRSLQSLNFLRWWAAAHKTTAITKQALTESLSQSFRHD
jgi:hypothetical protein